MAAGHAPAHVVHVGAVGHVVSGVGAREDEEHELVHHRAARQADERQRHEHHKGEQPAHHARRHVGVVEEEQQVGRDRLAAATAVADARRADRNVPGLRFGFGFGFGFGLAEPIARYLAFAGGAGTLRMRS